MTDCEEQVKECLRWSVYYDKINTFKKLYFQRILCNVYFTYDMDSKYMLKLLIIYTFKPLLYTVNAIIRNINGSTNFTREQLYLKCKLP